MPNLSNNFFQTKFLAIILFRPELATGIFIMSSANAFNLDQSKLLWFGKVLIFILRYDIVMILLRADVDPTHKNQRGEQAIDLLPRNDTKTSEYLRMAMYRGMVPEKKIFYS